MSFGAIISPNILNYCRHDFALAGARSGRQHRPPLVRRLHRGHRALCGRLRRGSHRELRPEGYVSLHISVSCVTRLEVLRVRQAFWWAASFRATRCSWTTAGGGHTCTRRARCSSCARSFCSRTPSSPSASCSFFSYAAPTNYCRNSAVHISNLSHLPRTPHPTT